MTKREIIEYMDNHARRCWRLLERIPEDRWDWRPIDSLMTLGDVANHMAFLLDIESQMFVKGLTSDEYTKKLEAMKRKTKAELLDKARESHNRVMKFYAKMSEEDFETETFVTPSGHTMSYKGGILAELEHLAHHRTQLYLYLRILGVDVGACDVWE